MPDPLAQIRERLVLDWQSPVYGLALRMLRNRTEAEDATQDVFVRLLERADQYDPARPMAPWVYRVATSVILNRARRESRRAGGRAADLPERLRRQEEPPVHAAADRDVIEAHLRCLPPDERIAVLLHYQHDLPKREVAHVLQEPRTTIQSRTARGLERLKTALEGAGHAALVPQIDGALGSAPAVTVPAALTQDLLALAVSPAATTASVAAGALTLGGIAVTKTMLVAAGGAAIALLATGIALGRIGIGETAPVTNDVADVDALEALRAENARLKAQLRETASPRLAGATDGNRPGSAGDAGQPDGARTDANPAAPRVPPGTGTAPSLAWDEFAAALAGNIDLILDQRNQRTSQLSPEDQQRVMGVLTAYMKVSSAARVLSPRPYFDERVLPGFVDAVYGPSVGLEEAARKDLRARVATLLADEVGDTDLGELTPLERYALRDRIQHRIDGLVESMAGERGLEERFEKVQRVARTLMRGAHGRRVIGATPPDATRAEDQVLRVWKDVYDVSEETLESHRPTAAALLSAGRDVLTRHDLLREGATWDPETHPEVAREMLRVQLDIEAGVVRGLRPEQRDHAATKEPNLIQFAHGVNGSSVHVSSGGI